jgi:GntR family transcriptional regulator
VNRSDHGRAPVHEQIAKMFGQTTEYAAAFAPAANLTR